MASHEQDTSNKMSTPQDKIEKFTSHMIRALSSLTCTQLELVNAQAQSTPRTPEIDQAWELLWKNLRSVVSLASVIRASLIDDRPLNANSQTDDALSTPLVPAESAQFRPLLEAIDESMGCAEHMSQCTADAFEQLIYAGHGDSDCAGTVTMVRLYGQAAKSLLETVRAELESSRVVAN